MQGWKIPTSYDIVVQHGTTCHITRLRSESPNHSSSLSVGRGSLPPLQTSGATFYLLMTGWASGWDVDVSYPLVNVNKKLLNMAIYSGFSH